MKQSRYINTCRGWRPWNNQACEAVQVLMAPWWLYGGYVFPVVVKLENWTFQVKFDLEGQSQLPRKTIGILTNVLCTSGPNLVIPAWMGDELWCKQAQNGANFDFDLKFDLEGQGRLPPQTIGTLTKVHLWSKFGEPSFNGWWVIARTNLVTDGQTDGQMQATTIPAG